MGNTTGMSADEFLIDDKHEIIFQEPSKLAVSGFITERNG